jgi:deazaflavin-dependent oxidoreductase (nitroreductase family)
MRLIDRMTGAGLRLGLGRRSTALIETTGRNSGQPRVMPVTNDLDGDVFWIVTEHGRKANYVRNLEANPNVRVNAGRGWRRGTARIVDEDLRRGLHGSLRSIHDHARTHRSSPRPVLRTWSFASTSTNNDSCSRWSQTESGDGMQGLRVRSGSIWILRGDPGGQWATRSSAGPDGGSARPPSRRSSAIASSAASSGRSASSGVGTRLPGACGQSRAGSAARTRPLRRPDPHPRLNREGRDGPR